MYVEDLATVNWLSRVSVTCVLLILLWVLWHCQRLGQHRAYEGMELPPGSLGLPILGETIYLARQKVQFFRERRKKFGDVYKTHLFFRPTVRVTGAENVRKILKGENSIVTAISPVCVRNIMGAQCISQSSGKEHSQRKGCLIQGLTGVHLQSYIPEVASIIQEALQEWSSDASVELGRAVDYLTLSIVLAVLYGRLISREDIKETSVYVKMMLENLFCVPINLPGTSYNKAMRARGHIVTLTEKYLTKALQQEDDRLLPVLDNTLEGDREVTPEILSLLSDSTVELMLAGQGNIASTMLNCILLLSEHPHVVQKLRQEIADHSLDDPKETPLAAIELHQLQSLHYLDHIVKEVLRLRPAVGGGYRLAKESFEIDGYVVPKDWAVAFSIRETHEALSIPRQTEFDPERWQKDNQDRPDCHKYAYIPFGGGARSCPGREFAEMVLKLTILEIARGYNYSVLTDYKMEYFPNPRPVGNVNVQLTQLKRLLLS